MSAHFLLGVFDSIYLLAMAAWTGEILFLTFGVVPVVFSALDPAPAGRFVRALFPRYYAWGATAGAIALPALVSGPLCYPEFRGPGVGIQALLILTAILLTFYAGNSLTPAINAARDEGPSGEARFRRLHGRSVILNLVVLAIGVGSLVAFATRPSPRTTGIIEPSPIERARLEEDAVRRAEAARMRIQTPPPPERSSEGAAPKS